MNQLEFRPGRIRSVLLVSVGLMALIAVIVAQPGLLPGLVMAAGVIAYCWFQLRRKRRWQALRLGAGDDSLLFDAEAERPLAGQLIPIFVSPFFVSLRLDSPDLRRVWLSVFRDELDPAGFRKLLARLRLGGI
ncbi:MAG: protein YgfX [Wenzhouxiangellaceae bacterium]|nr:protein YgfX [Wenzhouxiangellaceae bacterium]